MNNSKGAVALVTCAGQGIGRAIAQHLAEDGFDLGVHFFHGEGQAQQIVADTKARGQNAVAVPGDLTGSGVPGQVVATTIRELGRIDVVVNNAGVTYESQFIDLSPDMVDACYRLNFLAPLWVSQAAARWMIDHQSSGSIIQITSVHQERVTDRDNIYGAMKMALARLTESLAYELAPHQIRVNCVAPGRIETPEVLARLHPDISRQAAGAIPWGRAGSVEEIAEVVSWLASKKSSYVTGVTVRADGGLNLAMARALFDGKPRFI
ncbi:MAG: SDR family NAD(P)-dependent oxidoreductase [Clostridia bacterium]